MINRISELFREFFESERTGGFLLMFATLASILATNLLWGDSYVNFWHRKIDLSFAGLTLQYSVQHWINDGLMTIFFLLVGLEIERELYTGELSNPRKALLPAIAALGGVITPAVIHFSLNYATPTQAGLGIPMATDIAFSLAVLSLIGGRIPVSLKIFLTAFAIIDDLCAVIIIAIFYSKEISILNLSLSMAVFIILIVLNRLRYHRLTPYLLLGIVMWYFMLKSGVHPTITGVLLAFAIPFTKDEGNPSYRLQHLLHKPVAFLVLPLFAIANTGLLISHSQILNLFSTNSLGIILGLVFGKPLGIFAFSLTAISMNICSYPANCGWRHILGAGMLGGIGFTMSIFITNLAFSDFSMIQNSIISVILASLLSAVSGLFFLKRIRN
jgi:NhaA family Na+:H+ antiporter